MEQGGGYTGVELGWNRHGTVPEEIKRNTNLALSTYAKDK
jgi:hypothetical protein